MVGLNISFAGVFLAGNRMVSLSNIARACLLDLKALSDTTSNWNMHSAKFSSSSAASVTGTCPP